MKRLTYNEKQTILSKTSYHILPKLFAIFLRVVDYFRLLPWRIYRLFKYFFRGFWNLRLIYTKGFGETIFNRPFHKIGFWMAEVLICILEIIGIPEIYETISDFTKPSTRPLYDWEISMAKEIFGEAINFQRVRVDESAHLGPRQQHFCYVSFYIINSWGKMQNSTLIHELVHVWQYTNMGGVYISRALWAQTTPEGYDYGGKDNLKLALIQNKTIYDFNLEQQGDIISDYFQIKNGYRPRWGNATVHDIYIYEKIIFGKLKKEKATA